MKILKTILGSKEIIERPDRLDLSHNQIIKLVIEKNEYPVQNISLYGMAISLKDKEPLSIDEEIECQLKFKEDSIRVKIRVVYANKNFMGISVLEGKEEFDTNLSLYFKSELEGLQMRKIDPEKLNPRKAGKPHVFYGNENHELF